MAGISVTNSLIVEYERNLAGVTKRVPNYYFQGKKGFKEQNVITCVRYAFKNVLGFTPQQALCSVNKDLLEKLKIHRLIKFMEFPYGLSNRSYFYLIFKAFPEEFGDKKDKLIIYAYKKYKYKQKNFPLHFFANEEGRENACIIFNYLLSHLSMSTKELYDFFSKREGMKFLKDNKLDKPIGVVFRDAIDFLHFSLPKEERNEDLYHYAKFSSNFSTRGIFKKQKETDNAKKN